MEKTLKKNLKKILLSPWTAIVTLLVIVSVVFSGPTFVESVKLRYFDTRSEEHTSELQSH